MVDDGVGLHITIFIELSLGLQKRIKSTIILVDLGPHKNKKTIASPTFSMNLGLEVLQMLPN